MDNFKKSLIKGTEAQAAKNPNKQRFLLDQLAKFNVKSLNELTYNENATINVLIERIDTKKRIKNANNDWIGSAIAADRASGKKFNND